MRQVWIACLLTTLAAPVLAQSLPPGVPATPPVTKDQARQIYNNFDPATQAQVRQEVDKVKAQAASDPGFKAWLKSIYKSWFGK